MEHVGHGYCGDCCECEGSSIALFTILIEMELQHGGCDKVVVCECIALVAEDACAMDVL